MDAHHLFNLGREKGGRGWEQGGRRWKQGREEGRKREGKKRSEDNV